MFVECGYDRREDNQRITIVRGNYPNNVHVYIYISES
jgi:hypothetical protein